MAACAIFVWEPWPLTSFRLFSHLRDDPQVAWQATIVEPGGRESRYPIGALERGLGGFAFAMAEFEQAAPERRDELCRAWVAAAPELVDREPVEVRLHLRTWRLSERRGDRARPGTTEHLFTCTEAGAEPAGAT